MGFGFVVKLTLMTQLKCIDLPSFWLVLERDAGALKVAQILSRTLAETTQRHGRVQVERRTVMRDRLALIIRHVRLRIKSPASICVLTFLPLFALCCTAQDESPLVAPSSAVSFQSSGSQSFGSLNPENQRPGLLDLWKNPVTHWLTERRIRAYGWVDGGFTYSSAGHGLLSIADGHAGTAPTPNRFGNEFLLNGAWFVVDRLPSKENWDWGFRGDFYAGSDASLLYPLNGFGVHDPHFATDYRQVYFSFHAPVLSKGGVDVQLGRQNMPLGYETLMGPYRPLYSQTYYWIYFQVAATAATATWHATDRLDVLGGVVLNYNTIFKLRGRAPAYIAKGTYSFGRDRNTTLTGAVYTGPQPVPIASGHLGSWQTVVESHLSHNWSSRITQVILVNGSWDENDPAAYRKNSRTYGANTTMTFHWNRQLDLNTRGEWFRDERGVRTGRAGTFSEATVGVTIMPTRRINIRPEIRGDFSSVNAYGRVGGGSHKPNELSAAVDFIFKF